MSDTTLINDVSDTALWVAVYRQKETERLDALFRDPLAKKLTGAKGERIASQMAGSKYTEWSVVTRTCIIDRYVQELVGQGVDVVVNLGSGLDTRPYRLPLPSGLRWIEVDFPHMIELKDQKLTNDRPVCQLERIGLDLANENLREQLFEKINSQSQKVLVLTEGVLPYLSEDQVASLGQALRRQKNFRFWIVDYFSHKMKKQIMNTTRRRQMKNAPFVFWPVDWAGFFRGFGWKIFTIRYLVEESERLGRSFPAPWWVRILTQVFPSLKGKAPFREWMGYAVLEPDLENRKRIP